LRLGRYFGTTPDFWLNLQRQFELEAVGRGQALAVDGGLSSTHPFVPRAPRG
jgi:plasmid maintenance system antidote protein VapI